MKILVALGGNAILGRGKPRTAGQQYSVMSETCRRLAKLLREGHQLVVTHGNGPQVGDILLAYEAAKGSLPPVPLDVAGAQSQGMIGYMLQNAMENELAAAGLGRQVTTILTRTVVDEDDQAFAHPTKPVGPYYRLKEAEKLRRKGWTVVRVGRAGYRRVVPSPRPMMFLELQTIEMLSAGGALVIAAGGGGVPVVQDGATGFYRGVEAVIDKDLSAALLARLLKADMLLILTDVEGLFENFGKGGQRLVKSIGVAEAKKRLEAGEFPEGSMGPKVEAAVEFVEETGKKAVIGALGGVEDAVRGRAGTAFVTRVR